MADLHLNLKGEYFDAIKAGTKTTNTGWLKSG